MCLPRASGTIGKKKRGHFPPLGYLVCSALAAALPSSKGSKISNKRGYNESSSSGINSRSDPPRPCEPIHSFRTPKASSSSCRHKASHFNSKASRNRSVRPKISLHSITLNCALPTCLRYQLGVRGSSRPHLRSRQELLLGKEDRGLRRG